MTNNPFLIYYDLRKFTKIHFENGTNEDSHLKSAIVSDPLRDRVCFVFTNLSDEYEHQYVISFFELSYNERTLIKNSERLQIKTARKFKLSVHKYGFWANNLELFS